MALPDFLTQKHPSYLLEELELHRLTYIGGDEFKKKYLYKFYEEPMEGWLDRYKISHNSDFAAEAVDEYVRAIVQRAADIKRIGGRSEYRAVVKGEKVTGLVNTGVIIVTKENIDTYKQEQ